uniref:Cytochrome b6-f complex subunit 6 n=1 Tax=Oltmannsiellopsis viridis TaxID=51324 RepID=PETL_OLTVI|nr:subunit VI of cytochrome b6/f complex [Oltmannsiellopsis viridis]Q20EX5.1 RecName: Full=Cytochrome b6-f complex subunit 6; AltName: Full=Cytochrome b6-f complex subunit PetL; AltName: Full=Cytochrome b6-f complex subunit VI [Oltmannsiellopsis viridis]ABB81938.1 subunit VI of cytochrome b6/f complex [Oltmannsiellopsis viridis]
MLTVIAYLGLLASVLIGTIVIYLGLVKVKLI